MAFSPHNQWVTDGLLAAGVAEVAGVSVVAEGAVGVVVVLDSGVGVTAAVAAAGVALSDAGAAVVVCACAVMSALVINSEDRTCKDVRIKNPYDDV